MDKKITIKVNDIEYPCYQTMGAALRFKQETGRDIENMKGTADIATYIYCCVASACRREHKDFDLSLEEFCDSVLIEDLNRIQAQTAPAEVGDSGDAKKN